MGKTHKVEGDFSLPDDWAVESLTFESKLEPMAFTLTAKRITLMDDGLQIDLLDPHKDWFSKHRIDRLSINDATFRLESGKPRLRDIPYIYEGEFYIQGEDLPARHDRIYSTDEILAGEDSLPEGHLDDEVTIFPWDGSSVVVLIRSGDKR